MDWIMKEIVDIGILSENRCHANVHDATNCLKTCTYTVAGLPSKHSSSSQSWPVGIKATTSGFVALI